MNNQERIKNLVFQLGNLGYSSFQIKTIIDDSIIKTNLENISIEEEQAIIEGLENYIQFAIKCRNVKL